MNITHFLSIAVIFYTTTCSKIVTNKDDTKLNSTLQKMRADSFVLDIPKVIGGDDYVTDYNQAMESADDLKLRRLTSGVDSIEVRVWLNYGNKQQCIRIFNEENEWQGELITAHYTPPNDKNSEWQVSTLAEKKQPKSGWENFLKRAVELGILTLPDCRKVPDYGFATGFSSFASFEISTKHLYRLYSYITPYYYRNKIKEANKVEQLLELMQAEFDFRMLSEI